MDLNEARSIGLKICEMSIQLLVANENLIGDFSSSRESSLIEEETKSLEIKICQRIKRLTLELDKLRNASPACKKLDQEET